MDSKINIREKAPNMTLRSSSGKTKYKNTKTMLKQHSENTKNIKLRSTLFESPFQTFKPKSGRKMLLSKNLTIKKHSFSNKMPDLSLKSHYSLNKLKELMSFLKKSTNNINYRLS